ncbi:hypothetical protein HDU93_003488 [Gonapodya sp. JEL0774]|nr:hypothetical protein HDU93_003488 [Gonapodya sp. JEL0774]
MAATQIDRMEANGMRRADADSPSDLLGRSIQYSFSHLQTLHAPPELGGDRTYAVLNGFIDEQFVSDWAPFGGYILALCLEAGRFESRRLGLDARFHEPVAMSATLIQAGQEGPFIAVVNPIRVGGRFAFLEVVLRQPAPPPKQPTATISGLGAVSVAEVMPPPVNGVATKATTNGGTSTGTTVNVGNATANNTLNTSSITYITLASARITLSDLASENGMYTILSNDGRTPITSPFDPPALPSPMTTHFPSDAFAEPGASPTHTENHASTDGADISSARRVGLGLPRLAICSPRPTHNSTWKVSPVTGKTMQDYIETRDMPHAESDVDTLEKGADWCKWVRWVDTTHRPTTATLAFFSDYWNSPFGWKRRPQDLDGFMPTIEFQIQLRAIPDPSLEWYLLCSRNRMATYGKREWDLEIWDEKGRLLSVARQLCATASSKNVYRLAKPKDPEAPPAVRAALTAGLPVVALESTIITHGLPYPTNLQTALALENIIISSGCTPATIAIIDGVLRVGLDSTDLERLAFDSGHAVKTSRRDLAAVMAKRLTGSTTVSATALAAHLAGIRVFATGGIGGVHRGGEDSLDVSADLTELARTPVAVVCAGAKAILDIPRTLEFLETYGVPVATLRDAHHIPGVPVPFPAFYTRDSGCASPIEIGSPGEAAAIMASIAHAINVAVERATNKGIRGKEVTPWILDEVKRLTGGESVNANIALIENNVRFACEVAKADSELFAREHAFPKASSSDRIPSSVIESPLHPNKPSPTAAALIAETLVKQRDGLRGEVDNISGIGITDRTAGLEKVGRAEEMRARLRVVGDKRPIIIGGATLDITSTLLPTAHSTHSTSSPGHIHQSPGGVARNLAESSFRLGVDSILISAVGDDIAGASVIGTMRGLGIDVSGVEVMEGRRTAVYSAVHDTKGELVVAVADMDILGALSEDVVRKVRTNVLKHRADARQIRDAHSFQALDRYQTSDTPIVAFDGNISLGAMRYILRRTSSMSIPCLFEPTSVPKSVRLIEALGVAGEEDANMIGAVRYVSPNAIELRAMAEAVKTKWIEMGVEEKSKMADEAMRTFEELEPILQDIPTLLPDVITLHSFFTHSRFTLLTKLGAHGLLLTQRVPHNDEGAEPCKLRFKHVPARPVTNIVSVTGAGDTLVGCVIAGVATFGPDHKLDDVVHAGVRAAAMTVGAKTAVAESMGPGLLDEVECDEDSEDGALKYLF